MNDHRKEIGKHLIEVYSSELKEFHKAMEDCYNVMKDKIPSDSKGFEKVLPLATMVTDTIHRTMPEVPTKLCVLIGALAADYVMTKILFEEAAKEGER